MIGDLIRDIRDLRGILERQDEGVISLLASFFSRRNTISRAVSDLVCQFPLLYPKDLIEIETIKLLVHSLELKYAAYLQLILTDNGLVELVDTKNSFIRYIRQYHTNLMPANVINRSDLESLVGGNNLLANVEDSAIQVSSYIKEILREQNCQMIEKIEVGLNDQTLSSSKIMNEGNISAGGLDQQIDKINAMSPTVLKIKVLYVTRGRERVEVSRNELVKYVGVKVVAHGLESKDFIENLKSSVKTNSIVFDVIRWTTGEIKFWKDLFLSVDDIKRGADDALKSPKFWFSKLRNMARNTFVKKLLSFKMIPNCTMVLTPFINEELKLVNFDIMDKNNAAKLCNLFFLLSIIYMEEDTKIFYDWDDNTNEWVTHSFAELKNLKGKGADDLESILKIMSEKRYG